jgi:hypothetical protein
MQDKRSDEVCSVCGKEVRGGFTVQESDWADGGGFAMAVVGTPDRDFNDCDACNDRVHWRCSKHPKSGYCDRCFEKYGLEEPGEPFVVTGGTLK